MPDERNSQKKIKHFEKFMIAFAFVEPLATIPQIYQVWSKGNVSGVSLATWFLYMITGVIWLVHGVRIKDKPVIVSGCFWTFAQALVVLGILLHGK
jgi:uncharacterized protein with PQ loop repeat